MEAVIPGLEVHTPWSFGCLALHAHTTPPLGSAHTLPHTLLGSLPATAGFYCYTCHSTAVLPHWSVVSFPRYPPHHAHATLLGGSGTCRSHHCLHTPMPAMPVPPHYLPTTTAYTHLVPASSATTLPTCYYFTATHSHTTFYTHLGWCFTATHWIHTPLPPVVGHLLPYPTATCCHSPHYSSACPHRMPRTAPLCRPHTSPPAYMPTAPLPHTVPTCPSTGLFALPFTAPVPTFIGAIGQTHYQH